MLSLSVQKVVTLRLLAYAMKLRQSTGHQAEVIYVAITGTAACSLVRVQGFWSATQHAQIHYNAGHPSASETRCAGLTGVLTCRTLPSKAT